MCSSWNRWGNRPPFEVPAKEVVASRGLSTPSMKYSGLRLPSCLFSPSIPRQTGMDFYAAGLLADVNTLHKVKTINIYIFLAAWGNREKQLEVCLTQHHTIGEVWFMSWRKTTTSHHSFKSTLQPVWILTRSRHCCLQIITNWISQLSWHTVGADLILLWWYLAANHLRLRHCAVDQREILSITVITFPMRERWR